MADWNEFTGKPCKQADGTEHGRRAVCQAHNAKLAELAHLQQRHSSCANIMGACLLQPGKPQGHTKRSELVRVHHVL